MMSRTQITLDQETQRRARQRASDLGISLAEYVRRLVACDLGSSRLAANPAAIFDLGASGSSDIARNKEVMLSKALCRTAPEPSEVIFTTSRHRGGRPSA